jgi:hypothetical protein
LITDALSLTPALSRWERENRRLRQKGFAAAVVAASAALGSSVFIRG